MESLTNISPLGGGALLGQANLTNSVLDNAALESGAGLTRTSGVTPGSGGAYTPREFSQSAPGVALETPGLLNQSTGQATTTIGSSSSETELENGVNQQDSLNTDTLTGVAEGAPLVNPTAVAGSASPPPPGVTIKDTNYAVPGNAFFVSPNGNDNSAGRQSSPWRSIRKALQAAPAGSTVVLRGGTYREGNLNFAKRLTLQPYHNENVWIKGSQVVSGWVNQGGVWRKDNWNYQFPPNVKPQNIDPGNRVAAYRDMVFINGNSLNQVTSRAAVGPGRFYVDYGGNKLYIGENPGGKSVEATTFEDAFSMGGASANSTIRGLGFAHYAEHAFPATTANLTIENNTFAWNAIRGLTLQGAGTVVVRGNTFSYNGQAGSRANSADRLIFERNIIRNNNVEGFAPKFNTAGAKFGRSNFIVLRDNIVENNRSHGLWVDVSSTNSTIVRNEIESNQRNGIFFELSHKAIIASNLLLDNGEKGISILDSSSARIYNNTVTNSPLDIHIQEGPRTNFNRQEVAAGITWRATNNVIKNNILLNTRGATDPTTAPFLFSVLNNTRTAANQMVADLDNNAYYRANRNIPPNVIRYRPGTTVNNTNYNTVAAFRARYPGFERNALAIDGVATNPFFMNAAGGDYRLKSGSPANGAGAPLPADIANAIGVQGGGQVDLGALHL